MKMFVAAAFALAVAVLIFVCVSKPRDPGAASPDAKVSGHGTGRPTASGWSTYHGGPSLDGVAATTLPDAPERLWRIKVGNRVEATPVSADGRIYFTSAKGGLFAVDLDGKELWKISIAPDSFTSPPLLTEGVLVVGSGKGVLLAFEAATGKQKWRYDVGGTVQGTPNRVDLAKGKPGVMAISQGDGSIHGVDLESGKGAWKTPSVERCDGSAGVSGDTIAMGSCASALHIFSVEKAEKVADVPLGGDNQVAGGVALSGSIAFAGTRSGKFCSIDLAAKQILWTNADNQGESFMTPALGERVAVFGSDDGKIYGIERTKGTKLWAFDTGNRPTSPVIAGDRVVVASGGSLFMVDLATGRKVWSAAVSDEITSPALVSGRILVGSDDGTVSAYGKN